MLYKWRTLPQGGVVQCASLQQKSVSHHGSAAVVTRSAISALWLGLNSSCSRLLLGWVLTSMNASVQGLGLQGVQGFKGQGRKA